MLSVAQVAQFSDHKKTRSAVEEHRDLISRVAATHDRDAFEALFVHFGPRVKALMLKAGADHAQAEDLVQDVMMTVWRKVHLYSADRGSVGTWIFTIARNARIDRLRQNSSQPYEDVNELEIASGDADGEEKTNLSQRAQMVAEALDELPEEQRDVIELAYIYDMPQSEIAAKLELPLGTVKSRMRLAYAKLRVKLEELT